MKPGGSQAGSAIDSGAKTASAGGGTGGQEPSDSPQLPEISQPDGEQSKPDWSASNKFDDGFEMTRESWGKLGYRDWLEAPDGSKGFWDPPSQQWLDPDGKPMPADWSRGHSPTQYPASGKGGTSQS
jgi:hypothetical protein